MSAPFKLTAPATTPVAKALKRILLATKFPEDTLTTADTFSVKLNDGGEFKGVAPMLKTIRTNAPTAEAKNIFGSTFEERALVNQWVSLALQLSSKMTTIDDAEPIVPKDQTFLAGTPKATVADLLLYTSCASEVIAAGNKYPKLSKWLSKAEADELVAPLKVERKAHVDPTADGAAAGGDKGGKGGKPKFAIPDAEELERRKAEKEKAKAEKAAKKAAEDAAKAAAGGDEAKAPEAPQLDIRVGKIIKIDNHPTADKLYLESIDVAEDQPRQIVSGLVPFYPKEELDGALCLVVCNMKPKKLVGVESNGMVLCASGAEGKLELVRAPEGTKPGTNVVFGQFNDQTRPAIGKKTSEFLAELHTDSAGVVSWKNMPCSVNGTPLTSTFKDVPVK